MYALDGFAAKYTNAASEFGDYPPGIQLLKWWFVHLKPDGFSEGLMFAGYYFGVFVFLTPLLSRLDEALQTDRRTVKQLFWTVVLVVCLAAFPSMTETFYLGGMCADLVMAVIYGVILMSCLEDRLRLVQTLPPQTLLPQTLLMQLPVPAPSPTCGSPCISAFWCS